MTLPSAAVVAALFCLASPAQDEAKPKAAAKAPAAAQAQAAPALSLPAANIDKFAKRVRTYYALRDAEEVNKQKKELDALIDENNKLAKTMKVPDTLIALADWREIVRRGLTLEKPDFTISGRAEFKRCDIPLPRGLAEPGTVKELQGVYDNTMKILASVPGDFTKISYPVIVGLHPIDDESGGLLKDMAKSKAVVEKVTAWAAATYSKELLSKAIVIVPIMDYVKRGDDGITFSRPQWDTYEGTGWYLIALREAIFKTIPNYDARRIFLDGHGSAAAAAVLSCARFPGQQTGCIVRGAPPKKVSFESCIGAPMLFLGAENKDFFAEWSAKEGFLLEHMDSTDVTKDEPKPDGTTAHTVLRDAALIQWITDHPKTYGMKKIRIDTDLLNVGGLNFGSSYWLHVTEEDPALEKERIVVEAAVDREKNEILVTTSPKVKSFEVYLNDDLLDLGKELRLLHRKIGEETSMERYKGTPRRLLEELLDYAYSPPYCNTGEVYVTSIRVDIK